MALKFKHRILFVDDEVSILNALKRLFRNEGFEVHTAKSGREGLDLLKTMGKPFSLIVSDQRMPEMDGTAFLEKSKAVYPKARRVMLTGYTDMEALVNAINRGEIHRYLTKPWNDHDLLVQVRQELAQYELILENLRLLHLVNKQNRELKDFNRELEKKVAERTREAREKNEKLDAVNRQMEESLFNTVRSFGSLVETHSPTMSGHGRRVSALACELAWEADLPEEEITQIEIAALLHDIGKLGFPPKLLDYERHLTSEEKAHLERHPELGETLVQFIPNLALVGKIIRGHHENYDGSGYPDRLAEEEIPIGARIIRVADSYDKIVNLKVHMEKSFREAASSTSTSLDHLNEKEVLEAAAELHLKQQSFILFDPDVVKNFLAILKRKGLFSRQEKELTLGEVKEGMVLARSLYCVSGRFLLPHNTTITENYLIKLHELNQNDPLDGPIYILR